MLRAAAMTAALGLDADRAGRLDLARLPAHYDGRRRVDEDRARPRLVLPRGTRSARPPSMRDVSDLAYLKAADFAGVE